MKTEKIIIWEPGEYYYPAAFGFVPNLRAYLHQDEKQRPCILVIPGGGYRMVSPTEGKIVAEKFYELGYQTFVGTYTTNPAGIAPLKTQPLRDLSRMVRLIRRNAEAFHINAEAVVLCGFSAGAHLCGSLCVHGKDIPDDNPAYSGISNRPAGAILSYPVITAGKYAHRDSFTALLGEEADDGELDWMSLEKQVDKNTAPMFLWQTVTDELVPVENSYLMADALKNAGIPFEHHVFPAGKHGLSLADARWASEDYGDPYTMEQTFCVTKALKASGGKLPEPLQNLLAFLAGQEDEPKERNEAVENVAIWPVLADQWIRTQLLRGRDDKK